MTVQYAGPDAQGYHTYQPDQRPYTTDNEHVVIAEYQGYKASARCHPDDEFNFYVGYQLAMSRAMEKMATDLAHRARQLRRKAYDQINKKEKQ